MAAHRYPQPEWPERFGMLSRRDLSVRQCFSLIANEGAMKSSLLSRLRGHARQCREFAHQVPDASTRNDFMEEAEILESQVGAEPDAPPPRTVQLLALGAAVILVIVIVVAVAELLWPSAWPWS